ncbi:MAG: DUF1329 domain-containing protein [Nevskiaceae bacterium]|nr:MAG: DUF1329 domain-containing protein [Nevskiaceae bacterium]TBR71411.1 MAG: DUF1329 domain-containing protein [Nevskiaceae bacterium]
MKIKSRFVSLGLCALSAAIACSFTPSAMAKVSDAQAAALGTTLTKFGADPKANADGSIPAYTGGLTKAPAGFKPHAQHYLDPYAGEKPAYVITHDNLDKYKALLSPGTLSLFGQFPDYAIQVYPSHRSMSYAPWFIDNTVKNATTAELAGKVEGDKVIGTAPGGLPFQGVPFPIPDKGNGYQVMWNNMFRYAPAISLMNCNSYMVDSTGNVNALPSFLAYYMHPWSSPGDDFRKQVYDAVYGFNTLLTSPPTSAGVDFLNYYLPDAAATPPIWFYTPGQRRVRRAPDFSYDVPMAAYDGILFWDEPWGFVGRMDRFDFKLEGKQELLIPYNNFKITNTESAKQTLGPKHVDPSAMRWEKHRVWKVVATLKADARHAYSKRVFFVDEDSWAIILAETYDQSGKPWRETQNLVFPAYDVGGMNMDTFVTYNFHDGNYVVINTDRNQPGNYVKSYTSPKGLHLNLTPDEMGAANVR